MSGEEDKRGARARLLCLVYCSRLHRTAYAPLVMAAAGRFPRTWLVSTNAVSVCNTDEHGDIVVVFAVWND